MECYGNYNEIINDINISKIIKSNFIETILKGAMATGNWGLKNHKQTRCITSVESFNIYEHYLI